MSEEMNAGEQQGDDVEKLGLPFTLLSDTRGDLRKPGGL